jgi:hypothetical protein
VQQQEQAAAVQQREQAAVGLEPVPGVVAVPVGAAGQEQQHSGWQQAGVLLAGPQWVWELLLPACSADAVEVQASCLLAAAAAAWWAVLQQRASAAAALLLQPHPWLVLALVLLRCLVQLQKGRLTLLESRLMRHLRQRCLLQELRPSA